MLALAVNTTAPEVVIKVPVLPFQHPVTAETPTVPVIINIGFIGKTTVAPEAIVGITSSIPMFPWSIKGSTGVFTILAAPVIIPASWPSPSSSRS